MWTTLFFGAIASLFVAVTLAKLWDLRWVHRLPSLDELPPPTQQSPSPEKPVRCSVVVAARDEAARIEAAVRQLLAQRGVDVELIIVDDRSTDGTSEILRRLSQNEPRLRVQRVDTLPDGWLGKCHACHIGAQAATGDWILFTDADCWLKPDVIARAVRLAESERADHVTMTPGTVVRSAGVRGWYLLFLTSLLSWFSGVNRDRPGSYVGIGAFNLVRATAYRECGGYQALRLTVVDDVKLGLLLRRAGKRTRGFLGASDVECFWGATLGSMVRVMEKNYFAILDYRLWLVCLGSLTIMVMAATIIAGLVSGTVAGLCAGLAPLSLIVPAAILARRVGWSWGYALLAPFMVPVFQYAVLNSTWMTLRQGGVRWRDTLYPLPLLRAGNVR